jgi:hypothetical protein
MSEPLKTAAWDVVRHRATLAGTVTAGGKPVPGARVEITAGPPAFADRLALQAQAAGPRWTAQAERPDRTRTGLDGHFHFLDLPAGGYTLRVSLPREGSRYGTAAADVTLASDSQGLAVLQTADLALPPTTVRGKVLDPDGKAVPMAQLRLRGSADSTYSNAKGEYALSRLEAGTRELVAAARGFQTQTKTVVLAQAGAVVDLDITLQPSTP